ncbi:MAG: acyltransferase family protein, partial [Hyphomonas sp.]
MTEPSPAPAFPRRYDLDWLRIIAFGLLIFYHTGMFYVTWGWHVKSVHVGPDAEWAMMLLNPWRLALLFFISGVALRFAADKLGASTLARERAVRLGLRRLERREERVDALEQLVRREVERLRLRRFCC